MKRLFGLKLKQATTVVVITSYLLPAPMAFAKEGSLSHPALMTTLAAAKALNMAAEDLGKNPMDKQRRQNYMRAYAALPVAIMGLSKAFTQNELVDSQFATVMGMLGSMVKPDAPQKYGKFFQKPNIADFPKLGDSFPKDVKPLDVALLPMPTQGQGIPGSAGYGYDRDAGPNKAVAGEIAPALQREIAQLPYAADVKSAGGSSSIGYDRDAGPNKAAGSTENREVSFVDKAKNDLQRIEGKPTATDELDVPEARTNPFFNLGKNSGAGVADPKTGLGVETTVLPSAGESQLDKDFILKSEPGKEESTKDAAERAKKRLNPLRRNTTSYIPSAAQILVNFASLLSANAVAECAGGGKGGGGGGEQESGKKSGEILQALAFVLVGVMSAMFPYLAVKEQEKTAREIAALQAQVQRENADKIKETTELGINAQKENTKLTVDASLQSTKMANDTKKQIQADQIAYGKYAQDLIMRSKTEELALKKEFFDKQQAFEQQKFAEQVRVSLAAVEANRVAASYLAGNQFVNSANSLSTTRVGSSSASAGTSISTLTNTAASSGLGGASNGVAGGKLARGAKEEIADNAKAVTGVAVVNGVSVSRGIAALPAKAGAVNPIGGSIQSRLLAAANGVIADPDVDNKRALLANRNAKGRLALLNSTQKGATVNGQVAESPIVAGLWSNMMRGIASGSTRANKRKERDTTLAAGGVTAFRNQLQRSAESRSFIDYRLDKEARTAYQNKLDENRRTTQDNTFQVGDSGHGSAKPALSGAGNRGGVNVYSALPR